MVEKPHIFFEFHGTEAWVAEQAERTQEIAAELGGRTSSGRPGEDRTLNAPPTCFSVQRMRPSSAAGRQRLCADFPAGGLHQPDARGPRNQPARAAGRRRGRQPTVPIDPNNEDELRKTQQQPHDRTRH